MAQPARLPDRGTVRNVPFSPVDLLKNEVQKLAVVAVDQAIGKVGDSVQGLNTRLTDYASNGGGPGLVTAIRGPRPDGGPRTTARQALSSGLGGAAGKLRSVTARDDDEDDGDDGDDGQDGGGGFFSRIKGAVTGAGGGLMDKVKSVAGGGGGGGDGDDGDDGGGGGGGGGKGLKVTVISETIEVGVPLRVAYNQWTQFQDFSTFMKKVESVDQSSDEKSNWRAKVFLSRRTWEATTIEQVPDSHIVWRSTGAKGSVNGSVSFHELAPSLTHILIDLQYSPKGLFEYTGNLWRAQGRRARLEMQHFRRHVMSTTILDQDAVEGWRGEIRDSEVVKTHEEAMDDEAGAEDEGVDDDLQDDDLQDDDVQDDDVQDDDDLRDDGDDLQDDDEAQDDEDDQAADQDVVDDEPEPPRRPRRRSNNNRAPARAGGRKR